MRTALLLLLAYASSARAADPEPQPSPEPPAAEPPAPVPAPAPAVTSPPVVEARIHPPFPKKARHFGEQTCDARIQVGPDGIPTDVILDGCPEPFAATLRKTLLEWQFDPALAAGTPTASEYALAVTWREHSNTVLLREGDQLR